MTPPKKDLQTQNQLNKCVFSTYHMQAPTPGTQEKTSYMTWFRAS